MPKYMVKSNLSHDGEAFEPGQTVELDEATGERLTANGVVEPKVEPKAEPKAKKTEGEQK